MMRSMRKVVAVVIVIILLLFSLTTIFILTHHNHDSTHESCPICVAISVAEHNQSGWKGILHVDSLSFACAVFSYVIISLFVFFQIEGMTLVALKNKLSI